MISTSRGSKLTHGTPRQTPSEKHLLMNSLCIAPPDPQACPLQPITHSALPTHSSEGTRDLCAGARRKSPRSRSTSDPRHYLFLSPPFLRPNVPLTSLLCCPYGTEDKVDDWPSASSAVTRCSPIGHGAYQFLVHRE